MGNVIMPEPSQAQNGSCRLGIELWISSTNKAGCGMLLASIKAPRRFDFTQ